MSSRLIDSLATTDPLAEIFSDDSVLQAMLEVEAALACAAARAGAIPEAAARTISGVARPEFFDAARIARDARGSATPAIPLVEALEQRVRAVGAGSAEYVHWGATSQDVTDTAMILLLKRALPVVAADHERLAAALRRLSDAHAVTLMLGRTLLQPAVPITFGLKTAGWFAAVARSWRRLAAAWEGALALQLGGAAGTRAAFGAQADVIARELAQELGLALVPPWHTDRDRLGALVTACGLYAAALGKMARDVALLMQHEVAEVAEPGGGSSAMPHKRNPSACALALATAARMPGLIAAFLSGMVQEHERSLGGSQAEWPTLASSVQATGSAAAAMAGAMEGLSVDADRMRSNLDATNGVVFAEQAITLLGPHVGREVARGLASEAVRRSRESGGRFADILRAMPDISAAERADVLAELDAPERAIGEAESLRRELLECSQVAEQPPSREEA